MTGTYNNLWINCLTPEQKSKTCGYWYTVTSNHRALTAFRTRAALETWLTRHGVTLTQSLPDTVGEWQSQPLIGTYRAVSGWDRAVLESLSGERIRHMSNGQYTLGVVVGGTVHYLNPNVIDRPTFDYRESREMEDRGATL